MLRMIISVVLLSSACASHAEGHGSACRDLESRVTNWHHEPSGAATWSITAEAMLKMSKAPDEHCAARGVRASINDMVRVYESYDGWIFIAYVGKQYANTVDEDELVRGWIPKDTLEKVAHPASTRHTEPDAHVFGMATHK